MYPFRRPDTRGAPTSSPSTPVQLASRAQSKAAAKTSSPRKSSSKSRQGKAATPSKPRKRSVSGERKRASRKSSGESKPTEKASSAPPKRSGLGVRGAAPWVARHAAKQAEELRKRNAQPAPPGSARATLREPENVDDIKASIARLHEVVGQIKKLARNLDKNFFGIGQLLRDLQDEGVHAAKGYSTFDAFLDREIAIPRVTALRLMRITSIFQRDAAEDYPLDYLFAALQALDGDPRSDRPSTRSGHGLSARSLPLRPPRSSHKG